MKKYAFILFTVFPLVAHGAETGVEDGPSKLFSFGVESDFYSRYVWKGLAFSTDPVWQPSAYVETHGLGFSVWGNMNMGDELDQGQMNEVDYTVYYGGEFSEIEVTPSIVVYTYPSTANSPSTAEFELRVAYPVGPIKLFTDSFFDIAQYQGSVFLNVGLEFEHELLPTLAVKAASYIGIGSKTFHNAYITDADTTVDLAGASAELPWTPWKGLTLTPEIDVSVLLPDVLRSAVSDPTLVWGGLRAAYDF